MVQNPGNSFTLLSLVYMVLLAIVYFKKPRVKSEETKIYGLIVLVCLIGNIISVGTYYFMKNMNSFPILNEIFARTYLVFVLTFTSLVTDYVLAISINERKIKKAEKYLLYSKIFIIFFGIFTSIMAFLLPIEYVSENGLVYSTGTAVKFVFTATRICVGTWIVILLMQIKRLKEKKYWPMITYVILGGIVSYIQGNHPEYLLTTSMIIFVTVLMYFTIENPDLKLINELNLAKDQADKANNAKTEFLSSMSHEIRTPLNAIMGYGTILQEHNDLSPEVRDDIKNIMTASDNLLEIVNGILDISKIEANKLEIIDTEYEPKEMFNDLVKMSEVKLKAMNKPIEFKCYFDESIPPVLYGDQGRVKQIILNLLTNAIKYTNKGWIEFKVSCVSKKDVTRLIISVEDTGIGIKEDKIDKLFTKFERLEVEKSTTVEGTGLGLAITKKLVDLMNGKIVVQSKFGEGSKFSVSLDQRIVKDKKELEKTGIIELDNIEFVDKKVLVVDDNIVNLKVAGRLLEKYNVKVTESNSGQDALSKIKDNKYDLILLDDMMPGMSGTETLNEMKKDKEFNTPVIALTANAINGMKEKYLAAGFDDYIPKPIDRAELEKKLEKFLGGK